MKKTGLFVLLLATAAWAQGGADADAADARRELSPTTIQLSHPAGADAHLRRFVLRWIHQQTDPARRQLHRGWIADADHDEVHPWRHDLSAGNRLYSAGAEYEIVRALRDVNEYEMFPGQKKLLKETGQPYEEVGRVKIIDTRSKTAIGQIEYSCDGDQSRRYGDSVCREAAGNFP